jgi:uncharacterized protein YPO0396
MKQNGAQNSLVDYLDDDNLKGFRLHRLEVLNWGTFDQKLWMINPQGFNSLITGENASGKSTLVDAITTLLVPYNKIRYNQAAGALKKERTLKSYVLGSHKNEMDEYYNSKPVNLRDEGDYSVLLCYFYNRGLDKGMTLAQVFWVNNDNVKKFFVTSKEELSIKEHFSLNDNETDSSALKNRINALPNTSVFESYREYGLSFQQYFGIKSDKVLELFSQTVSMKSIDKITPFMRNHMLEEVSFKSMIKEMIGSYNALTKAYDSVQKAKEQISLLEPMRSTIDKYEIMTREIEDLYDCQEYLPYYFAERKSDILSQFIEFTETALDELEIEIDNKETEIRELRGQETEINVAIRQDKDGQRIHQLQDDISKLDEEKKEKMEIQEKYFKQCTFLGIAPPHDENGFRNTVSTVKGRLEQIKGELDNHIDGISNVISNKKELDKEFTKNKEELHSLKSRTTQIPAKNLIIRDSIIKNCSLEGVKLPFVGELIKVKSSESEWEGALERLLHNFGLSLLVPEEHYRTISEYVNSTDLNGRLVYFRVPEKFTPSSRNDTKGNMVIDKVELKTSSRFYGWIYNEMITKFGLVCCDNIEDFQRETKAITKNGQIKGSGGKHEKDDRRSLSNRKNYVLGWDNKEKIRIIENQKDVLFLQIQECIKEQQRFKTDTDKLDEQKGTLNNLLSVRRFDTIDWQSIAKVIDQHQKEIKELEESSDHLRTLRNRLSKVQDDIANKDNENRELRKEETRKNDSIKDARKKLEECKTDLDEKPYQEKENKPNISTCLTSNDLSIDSIDKVYNDTKDKLNNDISKKKDNIGTLTGNIASDMSNYKAKYPEETFDLGTEMADIPAYIDIYTRLKKDNLPQYEIDFKNELRENTIQSIVTFKETLYNEVKNIIRNINHINKYLHELKYNTDSYLKLTTYEVTTQNIREFKHELKDCLEGALATQDSYNEERFQKVKRLLDKFKEADTPENNWTNTVTDVRNWLTFAAEERSCIDDSIIEFYSDSDGKSGGQKEKLAYTILASALAYRFGPGGNNPESTSFRFVILDEAFGRSSDESTRYGLELFEKLNLQLLLVTPLKGIDVVTNHVNFIHMISNKDRSYSMATNLTVQEYKENKEKIRMEVMI